MSAEVAPSLPDTRPLYRLLRRTRLLLRSSWLLTGLGWTAGLFLGVTASAALLDLALPLSPILRLTALLLIVIPAGAAFLAGVVLPLLRRLGDGNVARRIEQHLPGIHNRLVSCIDLQRTNGARITSSAFYRRLLTEALDRVRGFRAWRVLDLLRLRRAGYLAVAGSVLFVMAWLAFGDRLPTALARIASPFADIPPASTVAYDVTPGNAGVLRQEPIILSAAIVSQDIPESLSVELQGERGSKPMTFELKPEKSQPTLWTCSLDTGSLGTGYETGFRYRVVGGRTWSQEYRIRLVDRPVIASVDTAVWMPSYMGISEPRPNPAQTTEVAGPEGGEVEVIVRSHGEVARGEVQLLKPGTRQIPPKEQVERVWFDDKPPTGAGAEGTWEQVRQGGQLGHGPQSHWFQGDPIGQIVQSGDHLFAYVYLPKSGAAKAVFLQWDTGDSTWSGGAFWGEDLFREGKLNSPARRALGALPEAGGWIRLDVPAAAVGLEGKTLRGLAFKVAGGNAFWSRAGSVRKEEPALIVEQPFAMKQVGDDLWSGRFPLKGQGLFRAELRSEQGHPSKPMKELRFTSIVDQPPQVVLERPGTDLVLSKAGTPPLTIAAFDDYGLAEVSILSRRDAVSDYQKRILESYPKPERSHSIVASLTEAGQLPLGAQLRYLIEARDRKGQTARTREFLVTLSADPNAADQQFANFEKSQDPFNQRLADLIAQQKKVQEAIQKLDTQNAALVEKLRAIDAQAATKPATPSSPDKPPMPPKIDPEAAKQLAALQAELAKLGQQEGQTGQKAQELANDLAKSNEQAKNLAMLPPEVAAQMEAAQKSFQQMAAQAMQDLAAKLQQGADPKKGVPDLKDLKARGDRLDKELEAMRKRMDALAEARKKIPDDIRKALEELQRKMMEQSGELSARELKELADYLAKLREKLGQMQARQADLAQRTEEGMDPDKAAKEQADLDKELEKLLADAKNLLDADKKLKPRKKPPEFPDSPYTPDGKEVKVPPKEEDTDEPLPGQKDKKKDDKKDAVASKDKKKDDKKDEKEEDEPLYQPALSGDKVKPDDRFKKKERPVKKKPGEKDDAEAKRNDLRDRQDQKQQDLQAAQKSLKSDEQSLQQMMNQMQRSMQGSKSKSGPPKPGQEGEGESAMEQLQRMLQSPAMQQAMAMAQRMKQGPPQGQAQGQQPSPRPPTPSPATTGNMTGSPTGKASDSELAKLPPDARAILLKLPPRVREELLQGLREQGPEGYGPFIEDYFKRLTEK